jgi:hypothetical protein
LQPNVIAEGNETPGGDHPDRRPVGGSEGDLLAERRARRASETGEAAITRRAEAAEATVQTLEVHVSTLQQRLLDVEEERRQHAERANAEHAAVLEREAELRRVKQREYAEQQLRVEAEDRVMSMDRESRAQLDRLNRRLNASEQEARELSQRLESVQRALAEAEQTAAAERTAVRRTERELQARLTELECRALEIDRALAAERTARERAEELLESMRRGHRTLESLVGETRAIVGRLAATFAGPRPASPIAAEEPLGELRISRTRSPGRASPTAVADIAAGARSAEMASALAAAVDRLRARAEEPAPDGMRQAVSVGGGEETPLAIEATAPAPPPPVPQGAESQLPEPPAQGRAARPPAPRPGPRESPPVPQPGPSQAQAATAPALPSHKHSMSWLKRWRIRRKQRRGR